MNRMSTDFATDAMIALLDASERLPGAAALRTRTYDLLDGGPGARVLDVGCGTGRAAAELHARGLRVTGIDVGARILDVARARWPWLDLREGDATALRFDDGEFDAVRADKVLHALPDPAVAVAEAHRVLREGGRVVLLGQDWEGLLVDSDDPGLSARIIAARAGMIASARAARGYRAMLLDAGFTDVAVEVHTAVMTTPEMLPMLHQMAGAARTAGAITAEEQDAWCGEQTRRSAADRMLLTVPFFLVDGRK